MWKHPCAACIGLMIFGVRAVFNTPLSSVFTGLYPLVGGGTGVVMARGCIGYGALCLLIQTLIS